MEQVVQVHLCPLMWSYYGTKGELVGYYPKPKFDTVIEPFAGAAKYALKYWDRNVIICDKYEVVAKIWQWLQKCSKKDILSLPNLKTGDVIKKKQFDCIEQFWLMGFLCQTSGASPGQTVTSMSEKAIPRHKENIAGQLEKIRNWKIIHGVYYELENIEATWFIDPPYQYGGEHYMCSSKVIDFNYLGKWCKERKGHIIVCENTKAKWLPFKQLKELNGTVHKTVEAIWSNYPTSYDIEQLTMF